MREFASLKQLQAYAAKRGSVSVTVDLAARQSQLSPDQYEIVGLRTAWGVVQRMLVSKAALKAQWEMEAPFYDRLLIKR